MKTLQILFCALLISSWAFAETINLQDGKTVIGKIIQNDAEGVKVDVGGVEMTYYPDEIKDIDGKPMIKEVLKAVVQAKPVQAIKEGSSEKRALILKFIDVFGTRRLMTQNFDTMLNELSKKNPEEVGKIRDRIKVDEIIDRLIPLYDKHFTTLELKAYIEFYSSVLGQKLLVHIADVMQESIQVSAEYMKEKFPEETEVQ